MKLTLDDNTVQFLVTEYTTDYIRVNNDRYERSIIISCNLLLPDWSPRTAEQLTSDHIEQLLDSDPKLGSPEMLLIGTGNKIQFPAPQILQAAYTRNIGVEIMDTVAACRTFNMLASDGRKVIAGLII